MRARTGWRRLSEVTAGKCSQQWRHQASGWTLVHCGHTTANWPWYAVDPAFPGACTVSHNGLGFRTLEQAMASVERAVAGVLVATASRCVAGVRRITVHADDTPQARAGWLTGGEAELLAMVSK